jgi:uncharacterized protein (DUF2235 family)
MDAPAPKKLVVCLDGTNNQIGTSLPTNVGKTFEMLSLTQPEQQLAYYDPGVGTLPASTARGKVGRLASRTAELAFGWGLKANLAQAYTWLMQHYQFRDEVYVFGFSRGAYTARALVGLLNRPGLLRPGSENLVDYAVREYATSKPVDDRRKDGIREFADAFCWGTQNDQLSQEWDDEHHAGWHAVPISYLGVWDTVEATGLGPFGRLNWPYTHELYNVQRGRHAVSIDEHRGPYREFLVSPESKVDEAWFAGVHCDVGGTFDNCDLASIALKWVLDGVVGDLLLREPDSYSSQCSVQPDYSLAEIHKMEWIWNLTGRHRRSIPAGAQLHASVRDRMERCTTPYRPKLPADVSYIDEAWPTQVRADNLHIAPQTPQPMQPTPPVPPAPPVQPQRIAT